jgi:exonuclease VII small subunit
MSTEVVRELFRNLETTLHDRLKVIEDILSTTRQTVTSNSNVNPAVFEERLAKLQKHIESLEEYTMGEVRALALNNDMLEKRVESLEIGRAHV